MAKLKHLSIPVDERLSHLSADEIEELFSDYHQGEQKVKNILNKYRIEGVQLGGLRHVLKFKENIKNSCLLHNVVSWQKALGRNIWGIPYCPICNTILISELPLWKLYSQKEQENLIDVTSIIKTIDTNEFDLEKYSKFSFEQKVILITLFIECIDFWPNLPLSVLGNEKFFPSNEMFQEALNNFKIIKFITSSNYLLDEISLDNSILIQFKSANYYFDEESIDLFNLWWKIAYSEVLDYLLYELNKKNLPVNISENIENVLQYMVTNLPIQQAMFVIWIALKDTCSIIAEKNWDLVYASKIIPDNIRKKADRLIEGTMNYYPFNRPYPCPQSQMSKVFSELVIELNEKYFTEIPSLKLILKIRDDEFKRRG